jgi:excisionase family DNA binding protein
MLETVFTPKEAAKKLRCSQRHLRRIQAARQITFVQSGKKILYTESDLKNYLDRCRVATKTVAR